VTPRILRHHRHPAPPRAPGQAGSAHGREPAAGGGGNSEQPEPTGQETATPAEDPPPEPTANDADTPKNSLAEPGAEPEPPAADDQPAAADAAAGVAPLLGAGVVPPVEGNPPEVQPGGKVGADANPDEAKDQPADQPTEQPADDTPTVLDSPLDPDGTPVRQAAVGAATGLGAGAGSPPSCKIEGATPTCATPPDTEPESIPVEQPQPPTGEPCPQMADGTLATCADPQHPEVLVNKPVQPPAPTGDPYDPASGTPATCPVDLPPTGGPGDCPSLATADGQQAICDPGRQPEVALSDPVTVADPKQALFTAVQRAPADRRRRAGDRAARPTTGAGQGAAAGRRASAAAPAAGADPQGEQA
jgi:hypothetical protein